MSKSKLSEKEIMKRMTGGTSVKSAAEVQKERAAEPEQEKDAKKKK